MMYMWTICIYIVKLVNLLFSVWFATGYIHSGEIKIFISALRRSRRASSDDVLSVTNFFPTLRRLALFIIVMCQVFWFGSIG